MAIAAPQDSAEWQAWLQGSAARFEQVLAIFNTWPQPPAVGAVVLPPLDWDRDLRTVRAMRAQGSDFVRQLAELFQIADDENRRRTKQAFPECWAKFQLLGDQMPPEEDT